VRHRRLGLELFYVSADSKLMAVDVTANPSFKPGSPKFLFSAPMWSNSYTPNLTRYDVTADGKRFLINTLPPETSTAASAPITLVLNWEALLKK
jgi:hypothetical protein